MKKKESHAHMLHTIFDACRQCGTCCRKYRKILLQPDEVEFIKKMGGHVGVDVHLHDLRNMSLAEAVEVARKEGKVYMIHPDDKGCVFLQKRNNRYYCRIYHYRPRTCRSFKCTMADESFRELFGDDAIYLLGTDSFGLPIKK